MEVEHLDSGTGVVPSVDHARIVKVQASDHYCTVSSVAHHLLFDGDQPLGNSPVLDLVATTSCMVDSSIATGTEVPEVIVRVGSDEHRS